MTQVQKVLKHMQENGSITQLDAINEYRIYRLASRISDLKRLGYKIKTNTITFKNQDGSTGRYAEYMLGE